VFPAAVQAFRDRVRDADCFLFASPEYNYSISGTDVQYTEAVVRSESHSLLKVYPFQAL
jgi:NAD(P)H-dependent FMN reductase